MGYRFFSLPIHQIVDAPKVLSPEAMLAPDLPQDAREVEEALAGAEFRDRRARERLAELLQDERPPPHGPPALGFGPSAIFAQPPRDLPALLRLADQLDVLAEKETGERAMIWGCGCGARYAVPLTLARAVSIRCERCGKPVELTPSRSLGEEALTEPFQSTVNARRRKLAAFFREAMARGWPVLVCESIPSPAGGRGQG